MMEPHLTHVDKVMMAKHLKQSTAFLEFGAGGSTYYAATECPSLRRIVSIESDPEWYERVVDNLKPYAAEKNVVVLFRTLHCKPRSWGWPGEGCTDADVRAYCYPYDLYALHEFDVVMIDGRFRVACALFSFLALRDDVLVMVDDFWPRAKEYAVILDYFSIIDTQNDRMVVLRKRTDVAPPDQATIARSLTDPQ
ncbi:hypothetical protein EBZ80_17805 [bacterium]|nr:hypothetical protein [bacterium]